MLLTKFTIHLCSIQNVQIIFCICFHLKSAFTRILSGLRHIIKNPIHASERQSLLPKACTLFQDSDLMQHQTDTCCKISRLKKKKKKANSKSPSLVYTRYLKHMGRTQKCDRQHNKAPQHHKGKIYPWAILGTSARDNFSLDLV